MSILPLEQPHFPDVRRIYEEGIATGMATFETRAPDWEFWNEKFLPACRFVAVENGEVAAWAALTPYSKREVYRGVAEVSLYVGEAFRRRGIGRELLSHLVQAADNQGFWTLQANIFSENETSIWLHEQVGFRKVGVREKIGCLHDVWKDNVLMERRKG